MPYRLALSATVMALFAALAACTAPPPGGGINDPYEDTNRWVHEFNKDIDSVFVRGSGQGLSGLPQELVQPISNFADNAGLPRAALNTLLQGDVEGLAANTMRFLLNSTIGVAGLFDPAGAIGIAEVEADFGQTLAVWGVDEGAYLELPGLGPTTERDAAGQIVDFVIDPLGRLGYEEITRWATPARIISRVIDRGEFGDTLDSILYESADSYAQTRLLYLQNRRFELGEVAGDTYIDPYGDAYIDPYEETQ